MCGMPENNPPSSGWFNLRGSYPWRLFVASVMLLACGTRARGLINQNYTPVDLVRQAEVILTLEIRQQETEGQLFVKIQETLQGKAPGNLDLELDTTDGDLMQIWEEASRGKAAEALMFLGNFSTAGQEESEDSESQVGALHAGVRFWFALVRKEENRLVIKADRLNLETVWAGSVAMLVRAIRYIRSDLRADIPTTAGVSWGKNLQVDRLPGRVHGCKGVDLLRNGRLHLFILSESGDRMYAPQGSGLVFDNITGKLALVSRSRTAAWGDFNGDSRLDLASWDGSALHIYLQAREGTFKKAEGETKLEGGCNGLVALDVGLPGRSGLLASTSRGPLVLIPSGSGSFKNRLIAGGKDAGNRGPCVLADFDGDGLNDIVEPHAGGLIFYRGRAPGAFEPPHPAGLAHLVQPLTASFSGDFDADGLLDLVVTGHQGCFFFTNMGSGKFREVLEEAGEVLYNAKPGVIGGSACDLNNDGRQEFLFFFEKDLCPQFFFNRGFRCFGFAVELNLKPGESPHAAAGAAGEGQQAGAAADFNGDGAQDVALVTAGGEVWILFREIEGGSRLGLSVALPGGVSGPIRVVGQDGARCLGARNVSAEAPALFGMFNKGPLHLSWQAPGQEKVEKRVMVLGPTRFELPPAGN